MSNFEKKEEDSRVLIELAAELLNAEGVSDIEEMISEGNVQNARVYLLGALDRRVAEEKIDDSRASEIYAILGISPDEASQIRQRNTDLSIPKERLN